MDDKVFSKLVESIKEAKQIMVGTKIASRITKLNPPGIKAIRRKLNVSQSEFALMIGVSMSALQNWEQGRREPDGPAKNPDLVMNALHS